MQKRNKTSDILLYRIKQFNEQQGGGVLIQKIRGGYSLFLEDDGSPLARLRPTGDGDEVEVLWWSHRDKWESIGDLGGIICPLDKALDYVARDPMGCFWK